MRTLNFKHFFGKTKEVQSEKGNFTVPLSPVEALDDEFPGNWLYLGRAMPKHGLEASPLANPYRVNQHGRDRCIRLYAEHLWDALRRKRSLNGLMGDDILAQLAIAANHEALVCWCKPQGCHADVVINLINWCKEQKLIKPLSGFQL